MGHGAHLEKPYHRLQRRLDRSVMGAPASPTFTKILTLLFSPEEAELARRLPWRPTPVSALSERLDVPSDELAGRLGEMAARGLLLDFEQGGERFFALLPVVIGFFEFVFMRARAELPMAELARLFEQYMTENDRFVRRAFSGETQLARSLVHEAALPEGDHAEVLDWERASRIVETASAAAVCLCACRHLASHLGRACDQPPESCLTLNYAAEAVIDMGAARRLTAAEAMQLLERSREAGLAQIGDNVQRKVTFICNCCRCCCGFTQSIRRFELHGAVATSGWLAEIDAEVCKGCGRCVEACPLGAIDLVERDGNGKVAEVCEEVCVGCGVCYSACKVGALTLRRREREALPPETLFDRTVAMAIERGKLADLIFDDPTRLSHRALSRILGLLERSPPWKVAMAIRPLRSAFMARLVKGAREGAGEMAEQLT